MTLNEWLEKQEKLCEEATEGPWAWVDSDGVGILGNVKILEDKYPSISKHKVMDDGSAGGEYAPEIEPESENGKFIAQSRTSLPQALKIIRKMKEVLTEISKPKQTSTPDETTGSAVQHIYTSDDGEVARQALKDIEEDLDA